MFHVNDSNTLTLIYLPHLKRIKYNASIDVVRVGAGPHLNSSGYAYNITKVHVAMSVIGSHNMSQL